VSEERVELTAIIRAVPGRHEALESALAALVAETVKEPGCREFRVFADREDPARFVLWEVFDNRQALKEHLAKDYTQAHFANGLTESTEVLKLRSLG